MKKVLIITYYWPPAGGPGVQRWLKFVKYLPEFGIEPIVYIPENPSYPIVDPELAKEVSPNLTLIKRKIFEPFSLVSFLSKNQVKTLSSGIITNSRKQSLGEKIALWIRGNVFIPDSRMFWVRPSVRLLVQYIKEHSIDTIVTSGPPHSLHLIGLGLQKKTKVKWFADFRDPWTSIGYHKDLKLSSYARERHKDLEQEVLESADEILVTSKSTRSDFELITDKPIHVITNGYDVESYEKKPLDQKFSIAHIGSFLSERNPAVLWQAISELVQEEAGFADQLEIKLAGSTSKEVVDALDLYNLSDYVNDLGYISHQRAITEQRCSQVLLMVEINSLENKSILPGKLFEYLVSGRPIIAIGPNGSDFAEIITQTNTGIFADYSGKEIIKKALLDYYHEFLGGNLKAEAIGLQQYSRKNLTQKLADLLR